jgi:predicted dehydrogenase
MSYKRPKIWGTAVAADAPQGFGRPIRLGILGAGMIATVEAGFLPGLGRMRDRVEVTAITSRTRARADAVAREWQIPAVFDTLEQMLSDGGVDAVLNLTPIDAHFETNMKVLEAGKHLVTEKPIASTLAEADELCGLAESKGLVALCAPADMLSPEWAQARQLIRGGAVGTVAFARLQSSHSGPAAMAWPADPTWFYQKGAGPLLDMGVYGIDRVTGLLGPARRVAAMSGLIDPVRRARGGPFDGLRIDVTEDDNALLLLDFGAAAFATIDATFNVQASRTPALELFGTAGTLIVNRPGGGADGSGPIELFRVDAAPGLSGWISPRSPDALPAENRAARYSRAVLVDHLADCLEHGTAPVTGLDRGRHVLEIMLAAQTAAREGRTIELTTSFEPLAY